MSEDQDYSLQPHLQMANSRLGKYPNPFFDLGQQHMPPNIKELFKWCTFYYYNSPLIGSTISKISRYPITDLIIEDEKESVRKYWERVLVKELKLKETMMQMNLDYHVYGNCFVSIHLPFTRFLICNNCGERHEIRHCEWSFSAGTHSFILKCRKCEQSGPAKVKDIPFRNTKRIKIIRWNPSNIHIKHNEYTGRRIYMYSVPYKLRTAIARGDKDIIEDTPMIVINAVKTRRMIRFNDDNFMHIRRPTLAEKDQGWGKPLIIHVLKDMYYLYTLRRAQEAIANEHIVPFDIIYPMPNAQQDPYVHSDLGNWRDEIATIVRKHRRDPNYKGIIPIPVGFGRIGGDGKALMLTPEMNYLTQTIVGGMGMPQGFIFGDLNWSGSSISLRTMENDFIQNRSQLIDFAVWAKDKIRIWMRAPDLDSIRFSDFRMADDVQKNQQAIGLNAQMKLSNQTMLTELGYNHDHEAKQILEETLIESYINDIRSKGQAKTQGETMIIQTNYQQRVQDLVEKAQEEAQKKIRIRLGDSKQQTPQQLALAPPGQDTMDIGANRGEWGMGGQQGMIGQQGSSSEVEQDIDSRVDAWATKLTQMAPSDASLTLSQLKAKLPDIGSMVERVYNEKQGPEVAEQAGGKSTENASSTEPNMNPLPENGMPTRAGQV